MIFVTVGTQLPFDRMIKYLDKYFYSNPDQQVFAQIGPTDFLPKNMEFDKFISPKQAEELVKKASLIIAHAGTGSIFTALKYNKPIIIMPRLAKYNEHRNDHQLATVRWAKKLSGVYIADYEDNLTSLLSSNLIYLKPPSISQHAQPELILFLKKIIKTS